MPLLKSLDELLTETALLFGRTLTPEEGGIWKTMMASVSAQARNYAFGNWQRNGHFFPKPKDILDEVAAFKIGAMARFTACGLDGCADGWKTVTTEGQDRKVVRCGCWQAYRESGQSPKFAHFGQGYGAQDISFLWKLFKNKRDVLKRPLTDAEINGLLDELDRQRKHSPAWKKTA